jgi:hypothetical protein
MLSTYYPPSFCSPSSLSNKCNHICVLTVASRFFNWIFSLLLVSSILFPATSNSRASAIVASRFFVACIFNIVSSHIKLTCKCHCSLLFLCLNLKPPFLLNHFQNPGFLFKLSLFPAIHLTGTCTRTVGPTSVQLDFGCRCQLWFVLSQTMTQKVTVLAKQWKLD